MGQTAVQGFPQSFVFPCAIDYIESRDDSLAGRVQYHLVGRAWLLGEALFATITAIGSLCIAAIGGLYSLVDSEGRNCARRAIENAASDWNMVKKCLSVLVSQQLLPQEPDLRDQEKVSGEASPQTDRKSRSEPHSPHEAKEPEEDSPFVDVAGDLRETRIVEDENRIVEKLGTELKWARIQKEKEGPNPLYAFERAEQWFCAIDPAQGAQFNTVGISQFIGRRDEMEDCSLATSFSLDLGEKTYPVQLFGVFDGHNGAGVSKYVKEKMTEKLSETLKEFNPTELTTQGVWNALKQTFVRLNLDLKREPDLDGQGTTAIVAMDLNGMLWVANAGDSRALVVGTLEGKEFVEPLSEDAKPDDERYKKSIEKRGGEVLQHRVNGTYAVARALEADGFWIQGMSARPKITRYVPSSGDLLIIGSDGLFDVASSEQIGRAVLGARSSLNLHEIAQSLVYSSYEACSNDNITALVAKFDQRMNE